MSEQKKDETQSKAARTGRSDIAPGVHPDHADVSKRKQDAENSVQNMKEQRSGRRDRLKGGQMPGRWHVAGDKLVNMENLNFVNLPNEGDETPTITLSFIGGGTVTLAGDDVKDFMEEYQLQPLQSVKAEGHDRESVKVDGIVTTRRDIEAAKNANRLDTTPNHPHRANAVGTAGNTDDDVEQRGSKNPVNPPVGTGILGSAESLDRRPATTSATSAINTEEEPTKPDRQDTTVASEGEGETEPGAKSSETAPQAPNAAQPGKPLTPAQKAAQTRAANAAGANTGKPK